MHLPNWVYKYNNLQTYLCKVLVSSYAAGFPVYSVRFFRAQLMILRVLVAFMKTTRTHTSWFRLPDIIYPEPAHSYSVSRMFWLGFMTCFHIRSSQILTLSQAQLDSHSARMWLWEYRNTLFFMNGLTHFLILRGPMEQDTNVLCMCSSSSCWKTLLTVACVPTASRDAQALGPGISTPNWAHCVYTTAVKRHKAAIQNPPWTLCCWY